MRRFSSVAFGHLLTWLVCISLAHAQTSVVQSGPVHDGHVPIYVSPGGGYGQPVVQDGGAASGVVQNNGTWNSGISEMNITSRAANGVYTPPYASNGTGPYGAHQCLYDAPVSNPTGYHFLCFDANAQGGSLIATGASGGAAPLPLQCLINGVLSSCLSDNLGFVPLNPANNLSDVASESIALSNLGNSAIAANGVQYIHFEEAGGGAFDTIGPGIIPGIFGDYSNPNTYNKHFLQGKVVDLGYAGVITNAVNNGSGLCRLSVSVTSYMTVGDSVSSSGITGATGCNVTTTISAIGEGTIDLAGTTFGGAYTNTAAGSLTVGQSYRIVSVGTTNFTLIGASANTVGIWFTATGTGSGTGTASSAQLYDNTNNLNSDDMAFQGYMPPGGGDASVIYLLQEGGGNALSVYNLCGSTPAGYTAYCNDGFAIEAQVDGTKKAIFGGALNGVAFLAVINAGSTTGRGLVILPQADSIPSSLKAIQVANAEYSSETFYVDLAGNFYNAGYALIGGAVQRGVLNVGAGNSYFSGLIDETLPGSASTNAFTALEPSITDGSSVVVEIGVDTSINYDSGIILFGFTGVGNSNNYVSIGVFEQDGVTVFGTGDITLGGKTDHSVGLYVPGTVQMAALPTSAGSGGIYVCIDSTGKLYQKSSCP